MEDIEEITPLLTSSDKTHNETINDSTRSGDISNISDNDEYIFKYTLKTYKRRWYVLTIFTLIVFLQNYLSNTWAVIAVSIKPLFGWTNAELSLMLAWYPFMYLLFIFPFSWLVEDKGLRLPVLITCGCFFLATFLRSVTRSSPAVTWLNNIAGCLIGIAMPVPYAFCPVVSALWFPPDQRSTTTSIMAAISYLGYGLCFLLGPLFVSVPEEIHNLNSSNTSQVQYSNLPQIWSEIRMIRLIECAVCGSLFLTVLIYFPNKPPQPPNTSAALPKLSFFQGVKDILRLASRDFWLICLVYAISTAIYSTWISLLTVNFSEFMPQIEIGYLGFLANLIGTIAAMIAGRLADVFVRRMKLFILVFISLSIFSTYWILLLAMQYIRVSKIQLFISIVIQGIAIDGPIGLYYEVCCEMNYPIHEIVTGAAIPIIYNIFPIIFLFIFFIPHIGVSWMNWFLYISLLLCFPLILAFRDNYRRLAVDKKGALLIANAENDSVTDTSNITETTTDTVTDTATDIATDTATDTANISNNSEQ